MATRKPITDENANPEVQVIFDDIRTTRGTDYINNFWRLLAHDPVELKVVWEGLKRSMGPGEIDPLTKEMIYIAVSTANACDYCIHSHTAAATSKGMSERQHNELLSIIAMAAKTNHLAIALQVPVDDAFKK